jgi:hypothetical protein
MYIIYLHDNKHILEYILIKNLYFDDVFVFGDNILEYIFFL